MLNEQFSVNWNELIPKTEWDLYTPVIFEARGAGIDFVLGGGLAFCEYSGRLRNTKDVDLFFLPEDRDRLVKILGHHGWTDYYDHKSYDRTWIYRGFRAGLILDLIWSLPNHRGDVTPEWLTGANKVEIHGTEMRLLSLEDLVWSKLYVMQRERCDWPDIFNMLNASAEHVNWEYLMERLGPDTALFGGVLAAYRWLCPVQAANLPEWVWERCGLITNLKQDYCADGARADLLDTRDWFGPSEEGAFVC